MNRRRVLLGVFVVVLVAGGYLAYQQFLAPASDQESAEVVEPDTIGVAVDLDQVSAEGQVVPLKHAMLSFQSPGPLVEVFVAEGDLVEAGAPLMRLDTIDQEIGVIQADAALTQAQANLETARAALVAAETGQRASEVAVQVAEAQLALTSAAPTAEQIALSEANVAVAEAGISSAAGSRAAALEGATSAEVAAAQAQISAAQAQYLAARSQFEPIVQDDDQGAEDREQAQLQLNAATANLNAANASLEELLAGATASEQVAANSGVAAAASRRNAAQAELDLLLLGAREERIAIAEAAVTAAEKQVAEAQLQVEQAQTAIAQAEAAVVEAEAGLASAETALEKRTLTAPFAATIAGIAVKEGEVVSPGAPVITLADFSSWLVETTDLSELSVVELETGLEADVTIDAFPGETLQALITNIATASDVVRGDVTYQVTVDLGDSVALPLRWGMTAFVTVEPGS